MTRTPTPEWLPEHFERQIEAWAERLGSGMGYQYVRNDDYKNLAIHLSANLAQYLIARDHEGLKVHRNAIRELAERDHERDQRYAALLEAAALAADAVILKRPALAHRIREAVAALKETP